MKEALTSTSFEGLSLEEQRQTVELEFLITASLDSYTSPDSWKAFIVQHDSDMNGFNSDINNASQLMASFGKGIRKISNYFEPLIPALPKPEIQIMGNPAGNTRSADACQYFDDLGMPKIAVNKHWLELLASYPDITEAQLLLGVSQDKFCKISPLNAAYIIGVEEAHHAVYGPSTAEDEKSSIYSQKNITSAVYNAYEPEWQALNFKIKFAAQAGMPSDVLRSLNDIALAAQKVRLARGQSIEVPYL